MNKEQELKKQIEEIKNTNRHSRNKIMKEIKSKLNPIEIEIMDLASKGLQLEAELKGIQSQKAKEKEFIDNKINDIEIEIMQHFEYKDVIGRNQMNEIFQQIRNKLAKEELEK